MSVPMRAGILVSTIVLAIVLGSIAHASQHIDPPAVASPSDAPLPLRGSIFINPRADDPRIRWVEGYGETTLERVGDFTRIDYVVKDGSVVHIDDIVYSFSSSANPGPVRTAALHRVDGRCGRIAIKLATPAAALKARLTRGDRVEDYWLVDATSSFDLFPTCDATDAPIAVGTLELFATLADGREVPIHGRMPISAIPIHGEDAMDTLATELIDQRIVVAFSLLCLVALVGAFVRPRVALHGLTVESYLPKLRFRIRLPRARIHKR